MTLSKKDQAAKEAKAKAEAEAKAKAEAEAKAKAEAEAAKKPPYYIAEGKSVTTQKGILGHPTEVKAAYFPGGQKRLDELVLAGSVSKS